MEVNFFCFSYFYMHNKQKNQSSFGTQTSDFGIKTA